MKPWEGKHWKLLNAKILKSLTNFEISADYRLGISEFHAKAITALDKDYQKTKPRKAWFLVEFTNIPGKEVIEHGIALDKEVALKWAYNDGKLRGSNRRAIEYKIME